MCIKKPSESTHVKISLSGSKKYMAGKDEIEENNQKFLEKYGKRFNLIVQ